MAVIAAVELEEHVAPGDGARDAHRAHRRLGAARDEAQHLDVRHALDDQLAELHLELGGNAEARAARASLASSASSTGGGAWPSTSGPHDST